MIYFYRYTLKGKYIKREGALLCIDGGFADCHPWEELGDFPLNVQLQKLAAGETTPLTKRSLFFAALDRQARRENRSLFQNRTIPPSHQLILNLSEKGGDLCKLKLGNEPERLIRFFEGNSSRVRLDFNGKLTEEQFEKFLQKIQPFFNRIDCIEDPFPYEDGAWQRIQENYAVSLACDAGSERAIGRSPKILVLKPAVQCEIPFVNVQSLMVTSYLDHPIGQFSAAYIACEVKATRCGLCSHLVYEPNEFSEQMGEALTPSGTGFGFDETLRKLPWKVLE